MNLEEAKAAVGAMVYSKDPGDKLIRESDRYHGPYKLLMVTKGGMGVICKDGKKCSVRPTLLSLTGENLTT